MKAKCYCCNEELTERNIKKHMKYSCMVRINGILSASEEERENFKNKFILAIKDKNKPGVYCLYVSIDANLKLKDLDRVLRDVWFNDETKESFFTIDRKIYKCGNDMEYVLEDMLYVDDKFTYTYDTEEKTKVSIEVADYRGELPTSAQVEIIGRNENEVSPRDGVLGYKGNRESENKYLPGNKTHFEVETIEDDVVTDEYIQDLIDETVGFMSDAVLSEFTKGKNSKDIRVLIEQYPKKQVLQFVNELGGTIDRRLKKPEIVEEFISQYSELVKGFIEELEESKFKFLLNIKNNNGIYTLDDILEEGKNIFNSNMAMIAYGVLFPTIINDEPALIMPSAVIELIDNINNFNLRKKIKENKKIIQLVNGMAISYGRISFSDIVMLLNRYNIDITEDKLFRLLDIDISFLGDNFDIRKQKSKYYLEYQFFLEDNDMLDKLSKFKEDFCYIDEEELIALGKGIDMSENGHRFIDDFSYMFVLEEEDAFMKNLYMMLVDIQYRNKEDVISDIIEGIDADLSRVEEDNVRELFDKFLSGIRLWKLKGRTYEEYINNSEEKKPKTKSKIIKLFQ